jgi:hypothetical protein
LNRLGEAGAVSAETNDLLYFCPTCKTIYEIVRQMSIALETACEKLELNLTDDPATRLVASKIIELAQRDVQDATTLSEMTLKDLSR